VTAEHVEKSGRDLFGNFHVNEENVKTCTASGENIPRNTSHL